MLLRKLNTSMSHVWPFMDGHMVRLSYPLFLIIFASEIIMIYCSASFEMDNASFSPLITIVINDLIGTLPETGFSPFN